MKCRVRKKELCKQIMGNLAEDKLAGATPFVYCAIDMYGPWTVTDLPKARHSMKTWRVMFSCFATKAVAILACPGYDTDSYSLTYRRFCALYGTPSRIFMDLGPQILKHANSHIDMNVMVQEAGRAGTKWVFGPKGCS